MALKRKAAALQTSGRIPIASRPFVRDTQAVNEAVSSPTVLRWSEPQWSYRPKVKAEISRIVGLKPVLRIVIVAALVAGLFAYGIRRAVPDLEFNWVVSFIMSAGILLLYVIFLGAMFWFAPPEIHLTSEGVSYQRGRAPRRRLRSELKRITIDVLGPDRRILTVEAAGKRPLQFGIASEVSTPGLMEFLSGTFPGLVVEERR